MKKISLRILASFLALNVFTIFASAQVAFDAVSNTSVSTGTNSVTLSHTTSGTERALFVVVVTGQVRGLYTDYVRYNGKRLDSVSAISTPNGGQQVWRIKSPDAGTHNIQVSFYNSPMQVVVSAISFTGVDTLSPIGSQSTGSGFSGSSSLSITTITPNSMVVDFCCVTNCGASSPITFGSFQTPRFVLDNATGPEVGISTKSAIFPSTYPMQQTGYCSSPSTLWKAALEIKGAPLTGINLLDLSQSLTLFPNPISDKLTIEFEDQDPAEAVITNMLGAVIWTGTVKYGETKIDVSDISKGVYLFKLQSSSGLAQRKFVKQ